MPLWVQTAIAAAALVTALGVLWTKLLRPGARLIASTEEMVPLLRDLTAAFRDTPHAFDVLEEIVSQFRTDSGSSLRDVVNRLDTAATDNRHAAEVLKVGVETVRQLAEQDRAQLQRLIILLDRLTIKTDNVKVAADGVADNLAVAQKAVDHVAFDLAEARRRADAITGDPGEAADAASQLSAQEHNHERPSDETL